MIIEIVTLGLKNTLIQFLRKTQRERSRNIPFSLRLIFSDFSAVSSHYNAKEDQITVL